MNEEIYNRIVKARIQIQLKSPFFSYLSLYLKFKEDKKIGTMGVNERGDLYYNPDFINPLSDEEIEGCLLHEILHLALRHLIRCGTRDKEIFNISADLCVNWLVNKNDYYLPKGALLPDREGNFEMAGIKVENIGNKSAEIVYDELIKNLKKVVKLYGGNGGGKQIDKHIYTDGLTEEEKRKIEQVWEERVQEAMSVAQMRGDVPAGLDRLLKELHREQINWRTLLNKYITQQFPYDFSYHKYSKRSIGVGEYMPIELKEKVELAVCIDLSGSIGDKEYSDFMSEVIGIACAYQERCDIHFYSHDVEGYYGGLVRNGNIEEIRKVKLKGGGGTSYNPVIELMNKNRNIKAVVWLTDGYGDEITTKPNYPILWVLNKDGSDEIIKNYGRVVILKE